MLRDTPRRSCHWRTGGVDWFVASFGTLQQLLHFGTPLLETLRVRMAWVGPMPQKPLTTVRIFPEHSSILQLCIVLIQNAVWGHDHVGRTNPICFAQSACFL